LIAGRFGICKVIMRYSLDPMGNYLVAAGICRSISESFGKENIQYAQFMENADTMEANATMILSCK